jgi:hypothetical protein
MKKLTQPEKVKYIYDIVATATPRINQIKTKKAIEILEKIGEDKFDLLYEGKEKNLLWLNNIILVYYCLRHNIQWEEDIIMALVNLSKPAMFDSPFLEVYNGRRKKLGRPRKRGRKKIKKPVGRPKKRTNLYEN